MIPVTIQTLIVSSTTAPSVVVLQPIEEFDQKDVCRIIPIWIGTHEATQIGIALEHARFSRPMTHDLFLDSITNLGARIDHVLINKVKGSTFFACLTIKQQDRLIELDARPSDAISLATRQDVPIYVDKEVLESSSFPYIFKEKGFDTSSESELGDFRQFLNNITPDDF